MSLTLSPVGFLRCGLKHRYETPRQAVLADNEGVVELLPGQGFDQAAADLTGFDRVWLLYQFHQNSNWKPKVAPPRRGLNAKVGVFATRSPHRPNPLGLSCVELAGVDGLSLHVRNFDLLDGTPVFDIKPYIPYCDSFPGSAVGWLAGVAETPVFQVRLSPTAAERAAWVLERCALDLENFARLQLARDPLDPGRKRVSGADGLHVLACRTWRLDFELGPDVVEVLSVRSGYAPDDLAPGQPDPYADKEAHRLFVARFGA